MFASTVQSTRAFKADLLICVLSGELYHLMLSAVTSRQRSLLKVGLLADAGQSGGTIQMQNSEYVHMNVF